MSTRERIFQNVLIIDDHILFREGLISLFDSTPDFCVVGHAGTMYEGIEKAFQHKPEILLVDHGLLRSVGLEAIQTILDELPDCKIIFLTIHEADESLVYAMDIGVMGYLLKNVTGASFLESLRVLAQGGAFISRGTMSKLV